MSAVQLENNDGELVVNGELLVYRYSAGDCDTIPWPLKCQFRGEAELITQLASCLYDERECGTWDGDHVLLPDGRKFYPDRAE